MDAGRDDLLLAANEVYDSRTLVDMGMESKTDTARTPRPDNLPFGRFDPGILTDARRQLTGLMNKANEMSSNGNNGGAEVTSRGVVSADNAATVDDVKEKETNQSEEEEPVLVEGVDICLIPGRKDKLQ